MRELGLFAGIGGISLGLQWAGFETVALCEKDDKCQNVLKKHWPDIPVYGDIKELTYEELKRDGITEIDIITGGFPCQDISTAGAGKGISGERSGLWREYARLIGEIRPKYAIIENVAALRYKEKGLYRVLADLAEIGYDAEWHCISASAVGAPHQRDRIWIIAYPRITQPGRLSSSEWKKVSATGVCSEDVANSPSIRCNGYQTQSRSISQGEEKRRMQKSKGRGQWQVEPGMGRVVDGFPGRVDRLKQLGNAVVPQIPYLIGMAIMEIEKNIDKAHGCI